MQFSMHSKFEFQAAFDFHKKIEEILPSIRTFIESSEETCEICSHFLIFNRMSLNLELFELF